MQAAAFFCQRMETATRLPFKLDFCCCTSDQCGQSCRKPVLPSGDVRNDAPWSHSRPTLGQVPWKNATHSGVSSRSWLTTFFMPPGWPGLAGGHPGSGGARDPPAVTATVHKASRSRNTSLMMVREWQSDGTTRAVPLCPSAGRSSADCEIKVTVRSACYQYRSRRSHGASTYRALSAPNTSAVAGAVNKGAEPTTAKPWR